MSLDIDAVAAGEYPAAPSLSALKKWAQKHDVTVGVVPPNFVARLGSCGGIYSTHTGALHLLYHVRQGQKTDG